MRDKKIYIKTFCLSFLFLSIITATLLFIPAKFILRLTLCFIWLLLFVFVNCKMAACFFKAGGSENPQTTIRPSETPQKREDEIVYDRNRLIENLKTDFVSIAAHQLRTPVSAIKWIIRMLMDNDLGPLTQEQKDYLTKAYLSNERMIKLINDLLNVTRIEEGRFVNKQRKVDLADIVEDNIALWRGAAERKGLKFVYKKKSLHFPSALIDKEKIALVLQNLVDNAISYTPRGSVAVFLSYNKKEKEFLIIVKDTGVGISEDEKKRIFSRFFRSPSAVRLETEGTGLGLYIAKNIVLNHSGKMWFESKEGKGTTFYFTLPA